MARTKQHALQWSDIGAIPDLPAGVYTRRSRDDQSSYSPAAQAQIGRDFCKTNRLAAVELYLDDDYSGTNGARPDFERMQLDVQSGRVKVVVVPKMDRFARDVILCLQTYDKLRAMGAVVVSVAEPLDFDTPMGRKFLTDAASTAEWYSRNLATEVVKGLRQKAQQGGWVGPLPLGYESHFERDARGERIKATGRAVLSSDISTVRLIFESYVTGNHSYLSLTEEMNARGLTTIYKGKRVPFQKDSIKTILTNPFYIGVVTYKGQEYDGVHEAAIDRDLWDRVQAIRTRRSHQDGGRLPVRGIGGLLSELAFCGKCGARMHTQMCGKGASRQRYYRCSARRRFGVDACDAEFVRAADVEPLILGVLRALNLPPPLRDAVIAVVQQRMQRPTNGQGQDRTKLTAQLDRLKDMYQMGDLEKATYVARRTQIQQQLAQVGEAPHRTFAIERATQILSSMATLLDAATDTAEQRALLQQVLTTIWITKGAVVAMRPAPMFVLLMQAAPMWLKRPRRGSSSPEPHLAALPPLWDAFQTPIGGAL